MAGSESHSPSKALEEAPTESPSPTRTGAELDSWKADLELARAAKAGDRAAVERFLERMRCVPRILAARNARVGAPLSVEDLGDLAQDVFSTVWRKLDGYAGQASLETWVYRFCVFHLLNAVRAGSKGFKRVGLTGEVEDAVSEGGVDWHSFEHELVVDALAQLEEDEARIIELKHYEDLTFEEIGRRLDISPNTGKTRYYKALSRMRTLLRPHFSEEEAG